VLSSETEGIQMTDLNSQFDLLEEGEYAALTGRQVQAVRNERAKGLGPAFVKIGRCVKYRRADVVAYINAQTVRPGKAGPGTLVDGNRGRRAVA
jgi:hypothetical protein